jgi:hypothetical protein
MCWHAAHVHTGGIPRVKMGSSELARLWEVLPSDRRGVELLVNNVDRTYVPELAESVRQVIISSLSFLLSI